MQAGRAEVESTAWAGAAQGEQQREQSRGYANAEKGREMQKMLRQMPRLWRVLAGWRLTLLLLRPTKSHWPASTAPRAGLGWLAGAAGGGPSGWRMEDGDGG